MIAINIVLHSSSKLTGTLGSSRQCVQLGNGLPLSISKICDGDCKSNPYSRQVLECCSSHFYYCIGPSRTLLPGHHFVVSLEVFQHHQCCLDLMPFLVSHILQFAPQRLQECRMQLCNLISMVHPPIDEAMAALFILYPMGSSHSL